MRWLVAMALVLVASTVPVSAHKFHASLAEIEGNPAANRLEVSIRLFPDDLEAALTKRNGRRVRLEDSSSSVDPLILAYVRDRLHLVDKPGTRVRLEWVGKEASVDTVWVYLQAEAPHGLSGLTVADSVFFELFDDQLNSVNLRDGDHRATLTFKPGDAAKSTGW